MFRRVIINDRQRNDETEFPRTSEDETRPFREEERQRIA